jgi:isopenicillin N synthase-like dioxygenase
MHGVPADLKEAVMETCKELFSLPEEEKTEYMEAGPMDPIRVGSYSNLSSTTLGTGGTT